MDRHRLIEKTAERTGAGNGEALGPHEVERVLDALFGTVERSGLIAEAVRAGETVVLGSFGDFHGTDGTAAFRPGNALAAYLRGSAG